MKYDLKVIYLHFRQFVPLTIFLVIYVVREKSIIVWVTEVKGTPEGEQRTRSVGFYTFTQDFNSSSSLGSDLACAILTHPV